MKEAIFKTERYWTDDHTVFSSQAHRSLKAAREYIKEVEESDPDKNLAWNLLEITFHPVEVSA